MSRIAISNTDMFRGFAGMQCFGGMDYLSMEHFQGGEGGTFTLSGNYPDGLEMETPGGPTTRLFATEIEDPFEGVFENLYREIIRTDGSFPDKPLVIPNSDLGTLSFVRGTSVHMVTKTFDFQLNFNGIENLTHDLRIIVGLNYLKGVPVIPKVLRERGLINGP